MKKKFFCFALSFALILSNILLSSIIGNKNVNMVAAAENNEWVMVWSDEFEGTNLNQNYWNIEVHGNGDGNDELQYYSDKSDNISVSDGTLKITAKNEDYSGKQYTSAKITSLNKLTLNQGKIEARIKLPSFLGSWPAFKLMGANSESVEWPGCGEIDIMESINTENNIFATAHWECSYAQDAYDSAGSSIEASNIEIDKTEWHTYGLEWNDTQIIWYIDGVQYYALNITSEREMEEFTMPQYIILNLSVGGYYPGFSIDNEALPATMEVDYIRAYENKILNSGLPIINVKNEILDDESLSWETSIDEENGAKGIYNVNKKANNGFIANLSSIGTNMIGTYAKLSDIQYVSGRNYTFTCNLLSDKSKNICIRFEADNGDILASQYVVLKANEEYTFETTFFIPISYSGNLSIKYLLGGQIYGENISTSSSVNISVSNLSMYSTSTIIDPDYENISITLEGYQISTTAEGFRTIYKVNDPAKKVKSSGIIYSLSAIDESEMIYGVQKENVYQFESTSAGKFTEKNSSFNTYIMTMKFIKSSEFYSAKIYTRAYIELENGTYLYSAISSTSIYELADYLYQNNQMTTSNGHIYLYNNILYLVNKNYIQKSYDYKNTLSSLS